MAKILIVEMEDCFGEAVNRACKLGEDLGIADDILVTKEAMDMVPADADIKMQAIGVISFGDQYQRVCD